MPWDPTSVLPGWRRWLLWAALAGFILYYHGPLFVQSLRPGEKDPIDFFQDWASARNLFNDLRIYTHHRDTIERYFGLAVAGEGKEGDVNVLFDYNAHPPPSVLLALPLTGLPFADAALVWNLATLALFALSLWLVARGLRIGFAAWSVFPLVAMLLICNPFRMHILQGQLSIILVVLVTGAWAAERTGRPGLAGALLGAATAFKLFPGFLVVYFAWQKQWRVVAAAAVSFAVLTGVTMAVLGVGAYRDYVNHVLPSLDKFRSSWINASVVGWWFKLFDPYEYGDPGWPMKVAPLWRAWAIARVGALASCLAVVAVLAWATRGVRTPAERDQAFGLAVTAMLLVAPVTWDHTLLLLLVPLAVLWVRLPATPGAHVLFFVLVIAFWMPHLRLLDAVIPGGMEQGVATPADSLGLLAIQCYALLALFVWQVRMLRASQRGEEMTACPQVAARAV